MLSRYFHYVFVKLRPHRSGVGSRFSGTLGCRSGSLTTTRRLR
jgi:hypothetical protein